MVAGGGESLEVQDAVSRQADDVAAFGGPLGIEYEYTDFQCKVGIHRMHEFGWDKEGYALVQRFLPGLAPVLDSEFSSVFALTYRTFGEKEGVDTQPFRSGLWHYVMRLFGVCNDDFPYEMVNKIVPREIKGFAKKVSCIPWLIREADFRGFS